MKTVSIIRIDYELQKKKDFKWVANIAAYDSEEAIKFLRKKLGNIKISSIEKKSTLDAITEEVENKIVKSYKEKIEKLKEEIKKLKEELQKKSSSTQKIPTKKGKK